MATEQLIRAIIDNNIDEVKRLVSTGMDLNLTNDRKSHTPLMVAVEGDPNYKIIQLLIDNGAEIFSKNEYNVFCHASEYYDSLKLLKFLYKKRPKNISLKKTLNIAFIAASSLTGYLKSAKYLLSIGANIRCYDYVAIKENLFMPHYKFIKWMVKMKIPIYNKYFKEISIPTEFQKQRAIEESLQNDFRFINKHNEIYKTIRLLSVKKLVNIKLVPYAHKKYKLFYYYLN